MERLSLAGCLAWVLACGLAGCGDRAQNVEPTGGAYTEVAGPVELVGRNRPPIPDLPVPMGFDLQEGRSRDMTAGGSRWVDHLYKGRADKYAIARFYERQMPISRWVLMSKMFVQGNLVLEFDKQTERCRILISDGGFLRPCEVRVQMWSARRIEDSGLAKFTTK